MDEVTPPLEPGEEQIGEPLPRKGGFLRITVLRSRVPAVRIRYVDAITGRTTASVLRLEELPLLLEAARRARETS